MDSADDLSSLLACMHYLYVGITSMGSSALCSRSKALKDVQFILVVGSDRAMTLDTLGAQ